MLDRGSSAAPGRGPFNGFLGGVWRVVTAPLMVPQQMLRGSVEKNIFYGATVGFVRGVAYGAANVVGGTVQALANAIPPNPFELVSRKMAYTQGNR